MKMTSIHLVLFFGILTASCSKEKTCDDPIDCLPPITQIGANTAGCLVNGKMLKPGGQSLNSGSVLQAQYNFSQGSYFFGLSFVNRQEESKAVSLEVRSQELVEGETYKLQQYSSVTDSNSGFYMDEILGGYRTTETATGELFISKLDKTNRIVSGTFWFDAINNEGEIIQIRHGRFDVKYY